MSEPHPDEDLLLDLALADLVQPLADSVETHLSGCASCRAQYLQMADAVDHVLPAAPGIDPPAGFSRSVLDAMAARRASDRASRQAARAPRARLAAAAALVLLAAAGGAAAAIWTAGPPTAPAQVAAPGPAFVALDGTAVGTLLTSWYDGEPVYVVTVDGAVPGARYDCRLVLSDGSAVDAGSWTMPASGAATWIVTQSDQQAARMDLLVESGKVWASARL